MVRAKELVKMNSKDLETKLTDLKKTYSREYVKVKVGSKSEKALCLANVKKDIARVKTVLNQKSRK